MKFIMSEHNQGNSIVPIDLRDEIEDAIGVIATKPTKGASGTLRSEMLDRLKILGWPSKTGLSQESGMTITSVKRQIGLCVQTGNVASIYRDMMKLQALYMDDSITAGIIILPSTPVAKILGQNLAQADRFLRELNVFRKVYTLPTLIFALEEL